MSDVFNENKFTILNEWSKQWYVYQHCWQSALTNILKSITFTELTDSWQEYLLLWMSDVFNDNKFTILNEWSKQIYVYQHCW